MFFHTCQSKQPATSINKREIKETDRFDKLVFNLSNIERPRKQVEKQRDGQDGQVFFKKMPPSYKEKKKNFKKISKFLWRL
jgi:hypothetical protein